MTSLVLFLLLGSAKADILTGTYVGTTAAGVECQITLNSKYYFPDEKHPLSEKLNVTLNGLNWDLAHPPMVDAEAGLIMFDHNQFHQILAVTDNGRKASQALVLKINHDVEPHPATAFTFIEQDYIDSSKSYKVDCSDLIKQ